MAYKISLQLEQLLLKLGTKIEGEVRIGDGVRFGHYDIIQGARELPTVVGHNVYIGDFVEVLQGVEIGGNTKIGPYVILGYPTKADLTGKDISYPERVRDSLIKERTTIIGTDSIIRSHSVVYAHTKLGAELQTGHHVTIREHTRLEKKCAIGSYTMISSNVSVGNKVLIEDHCFITRGTKIGDGVFIAPGCMFSENKDMIRLPDHDYYGPVIGDYVRIGENCTLIPGISIGDDVFIGAGAIVTKDVPAGVLVYGVPAKVIRKLTKEEIMAYRKSVGK